MAAANRVAHLIGGLEIIELRLQQLDPHRPIGVLRPRQAVGSGNGGQLFSTYKLEGLTILNANQVAIINDNDFGIDPANRHVPTPLWKLRLVAQLPVAK